MDISLLFPILILLLFIPIFLSSRKQKRVQQQMQALQSSLEPGDIVSTTSGLRATVVDASYEDTVDLEIADGVVTTWVRAAVREKIAGEEPVHAEEPPVVVDEPAATPSLEKTPETPAPAASPEQPNLVKDVETSRGTSREKDDSTNGSPRS
ncbi:MAG TPA: preprotein translocase subunit YajC [Pseudonocardia sp.]|jgi:preprotein translocase subunit YajC|nr:preprotein translocase subunit YajC [Pseudonocardia sp.]